MFVMYGKIHCHTVITQILLCGTHIFKVIIHLKFILHLTRSSSSIRGWSHWPVTWGRGVLQPPPWSCHSVVGQNIMCYSMPKYMLYAWKTYRLINESNYLSYSVKLSSSYTMTGICHILLNIIIPVPFSLPNCNDMHFVLLIYM